MPPGVTAATASAAAVLPAMAVALTLKQPEALSKQRLFQPSPREEMEESAPSPALLLMAPRPPFRAAALARQYSVFRQQVAPSLCQVPRSAVMVVAAAIKPAKEAMHQAPLSERTRTDRPATTSTRMP